MATIDEAAVDELVLYIDHDGDLYRQIGKPIMANLAQKMLKGTYNATLAVKAWQYLADAGAKKYTKEFGGEGGADLDGHSSGSFGIFNAATRKAVAKELAEHFDQQVKDGEYDLAKLAGVSTKDLH